MSRLTVRSSSLVWVVLLSLLALPSCGDNGTEPGETPTITVSLDPAAASIEQGGSADVQVTVTGSGGFSGSPSVTVEGLPAGVTGSVSNVQTSGGTTTGTVTVFVGEAVPAGTYNIVVRATASGVTAVTVNFALTVTEAPAYELSAAPTQLMIEQTDEATTDLTITRTNFTGEVTLAVEGAPEGMTTSFDVNPVAADAAVLTIAPGEAVAPGTYELTIRGTTATLTDRTVAVSVTVTELAVPDFMLAVVPASLTIDQGNNEQAVVTVTRSNFTGDVTLATEGVPEGVTISFSENPVNDDDADMTVAVAPGVATGDYSFTLRGSADGLTDRTVTVEFTVTAPPAYTLTLEPTSLSIDQGASGTVNVALARTNFTGDVTLSVEGAPAGVAGQFSVNPVAGDASVLTLEAALSVPAGSYTLTVRGTTTSLGDQTATLTLTVVEVASFSIAAVESISIQQGSSGTREVGIIRNGGFADDVTVTVTDLPAGITATVNPVTTAGNSVDITLDVAANTPTGNYTATVRGNAAGQPESTQPFQITVTTASGQSVSLDFSTCTAVDTPVWFAYQDGAGAWTPVDGLGDVYTFNVTAANAGIAFATTPAAGQSNVVVFYATTSEFLTVDLEELCGTIPTGKTVTATVSGITVNDRATLTLGGSIVSRQGPGAVTFQDVPDGIIDLVGYRASFAVTDRMYILRGQNPDAGSDIGPIDFDGIGSFATTSATITLAGSTGSGGLWETEYATSPAAGVCHYASLQFEQLYFTNQFTARGAAAGQQSAGDYHVFTATEATASGSTMVSQMFATLADRTITFGQALPTPTVTDITGTAAYRRVRYETTLPAEYNDIVAVGLADSGGDRGFVVFASSAWLGGLSVSLEVPDLTGLPGWDDAWAPTNASTSDWYFSATGWTGDDCTEGAREVATTRFGTIG